MRRADETRTPANQVARAARARFLADEPFQRTCRRRDAHRADGIDAD